MSHAIPAIVGQSTVMKENLLYYIRVLMLVGALLYLLVACSTSAHAQSGEIFQSHYKATHSLALPAGATRLKPCLAHA